MPEYLAPGVFVEEVSFRSKSIEGVATSTTGFAGLARYGPVCFPSGPRNCEPRLITSFTEFERVYGGLEALHHGPADPGVERVGYLAHAVRAFFENGGKRLYISRVFSPRDPGGTPDWGVASLAMGEVPAGSGAIATWRARWPGRAGEVHVSCEVVRSKNLASVQAGSVVVSRVSQGSVVEVFDPPPPGTQPPTGNDPLDPNTLRVVRVLTDGTQEFLDSTGTHQAVNAGQIVQLVEARAIVQVDAERRDEFGELAGSPEQRRFVGRILEQHDPEDEDAVVWLDWDAPADPFAPAALLVALQANGGRLTGGHDGLLASATDFAGQAADPDDINQKATGLEALAEVDDIAIVALPDGGALPTTIEVQLAAQALISHAERARYRIAVIDGPEGSSLNEIRDFRGTLDSKYAALYHPWIEIADPTQRAAQGAPPRRLVLPPSGFITGIYARTDVERGVHKAPANEVIRGLAGFESNINTPRNEVLNPEGINVLRSFEGRGSRVWGARTISSDPEWKYVPVRRLFIFVEHSIDNGTQWAVFEPNGPRLWSNIRRTVEDFLLNLWKEGALLGAKPEEAFFVRCDRTTMTQNDIDNGRLICLVGIAPIKPAEFVIFRVGQWTADAQSS